MLKSELMEKASDYVARESSLLYLTNSREWMRQIEERFNWKQARIK